MYDLTENNDVHMYIFINNISYPVKIKIDSKLPNAIQMHSTMRI